MNLYDHGCDALGNLRVYIYFKGTSLFKACFGQQVAEMKIGTYAQGFCFEVLC